MPTDSAALFLDLMVNVLTGRIYEDVPLPFRSTQDAGPIRAGEYDAKKRETGWDWPSVAHSMIGVRRMNNLRDECERVLRESIPGDFIETGVWRGGASIMMRAVLKAYGVTDRRVFAADSFAGLPPPSPGIKADADSKFHTYPDLSVSLDQVKANFAKYGLLDEQVVFLPGLFKDTLSAAPVDTIAVLRLDGDMYESTMDSLKALYHKVSRGGAVIIDDYELVPACKSAVDEFRRDHVIAEPLQFVGDGIGAWWVKDMNRAKSKWISLAERSLTRSARP